MKNQDKTYKLILAGNPNVGKSTVFNALTGLKQHTGNWAGKTVGCAVGEFSLGEKKCIIQDIPGTYSLFAHSPEEKIARDSLCFDECDAIIVVCDATTLERNLALALSVMEIRKNVIVCINLMDEAKRKHIKIDLDRLEDRLGIPAVGTAAQRKGGIDPLKTALNKLMCEDQESKPYRTIYPSRLEEHISPLTEHLKSKGLCLPEAWVAMRMLEAYPNNRTELLSSIAERSNADIFDEETQKKVNSAISELEGAGLGGEKLRDIIYQANMISADMVCDGCIKKEKGNNSLLDRLFIGKRTSYPIMMAMLALILWITIVGANYPSSLLTAFFSFAGERLSLFLSLISTPKWLESLLAEGVFRTVSWIVAVMLPPMAIFFPLFTILEDLGYLPRVAFNLDKPFAKCNSCGKQALTMCMGLGCNAVGVTGCRIIDSRRERLIAIITNSFVPCNGRFPLFTALISMFFITGAGIGASFVSSLFLTFVISLGIIMTFIVSNLLSKTLLRGMSSSFTLELPPYRPPQVGKIILRSLFDRTVFVLGRALISAIPAGILIWIFANVNIGSYSILYHLSSLLEPFASLMGLDGVILLAFILGLPANEIVIPIIIMAYMQGSSLCEYSSLTELKALLISNGWTVTTAVCAMLFSLFHWPCATTIMTIKKETKSLKWTLLSVLIPTIIGFLLCMSVNFLSKAF